VAGLFSIEKIEILVYYKLYEKDNRYISIEDRFMVKNNIEVDVKVKCIEQGKTQVKLAEEIDTTKAYVNRVIKKPDGVVNRTFVQMMEALGYDIELYYVKREG
jgi:transcriptional regulator